MNFFKIDNQTNLTTSASLKDVKAIYPNAKQISSREYLNRQTSDDYDTETAAVEEFLANI